MKTLYLIETPLQRALILKDGAPHDLEAPVLHRHIAFPWMPSWSSPLGAGAKVWARVAEVNKALGVAFLDTGKSVPPRLDRGTRADNRLMVQLKDKANLREGAWVCAEVTTDAREDKGPKGRMIPPIPEVAQSKGKAQLLRPAADPLAALADLADAAVCVSKPDAVAAIRAARPDLPVDFFTGDAPNPADPIWNLTDGLRAELPGGLSLIVEPGITGTMIDVNATVASNQRLATNQRAAKEVARVVQGANLGGLIVVDFLNLDTKAERASLTDSLREAFDDSICEVTVEPVNHLGVALITRARRGFALPTQTRLLDRLADGDPSELLPEVYAQALKEALAHG